MAKFYELDFGLPTYFDSFLTAFDEENARNSRSIHMNKGNDTECFLSDLKGFNLK